MKILYDPQILTRQVYGGISRYFYELISYLHNSEISVNLPLVHSNNYYLKSSPFYKNIPLLNGQKRVIKILNGFRAAISMRMQNYDIFHPTYYNPYFLNHIGNKPFVLTIYDMIHEIFPEKYPAMDRTSEYKKILAQKASKIIVFSENTKQDIIKYLNIDESKIEIIYLASSLRIKKKEEAEEDLKLPDRYLLFVGDRWLYKNFRTFIKAIAPILRKETDLCLICAGSHPFTDEEITLLNGLGVNRQVLHYTITDNSLVKLYKNARAFVFPSLYEGFGIPVLEAFNCGCPLITSNVSSLPEVAADAAMYFNPADELSIRQAVNTVLNSENLRKTLITKGFERAKDFSWEKTAKKTLSLYEAL